MSDLAFHTSWKSITLLMFKVAFSPINHTHLKKASLLKFKKVHFKVLNRIKTKVMASKDCSLCVVMASPMPEYDIFN